MNGIYNFDEKKPELVYWTTSQKDSEIIKFCNQAYEENKRAVLIIPEKSSQKFSVEILGCFDKLNEHLLVYEINMGMSNNLKKRANKYVEYHPNSELYTKT